MRPNSHAALSLLVAIQIAACLVASIEARAQVVDNWQLYANGNLVFDSNVDNMGFSAFPALMSQAAFDALPANQRTGKKGVGTIAWRTLTDLTGNDSNRGRLSRRDGSVNKLSAAMECS